jgi:hypothetical protein
LICIFLLFLQGYDGLHEATEHFREVFPAQTDDELFAVLAPRLVDRAD